MFRTRVDLQMLLEGFHFRTLDERGGVNYLLNTGVDLGLDMRVLGL